MDRIMDQQLPSRDWKVLEEYMHLLEPLKEGTDLLQGGTESPKAEYIGLGNVVATLEYILSAFETAKENYKKEAKMYVASQRRSRVLTEAQHEAGEFTAHYLAAIEQAWVKANEYYKLFDESPAYAAAIVLDPRRKRTTLNHMWACHSDWVHSAKISITDLWCNYYRKEPARKGPPTSLSQAAPRSKLGAYLQKHLQFVREAQLPPVEDDVYEDLIEKPPVNEDVNPFEYWTSVAIRDQYPQLSRTALDILPIPSMSDEPERIFSLSGHLVSPRRSRLKADVIEASECLGDWERKKFIKIGHHERVEETSDDEVHDRGGNIVEDVTYDPEATDDDDDRNLGDEVDDDELN